MGRRPRATRTALLPLPGLSLMVHPTYSPTSCSRSTYVCRFAPATNRSAGTVLMLPSLISAEVNVNQDMVRPVRSGGFANTLTSAPHSSVPAIATTEGRESNLTSSTSATPVSPSLWRLEAARSTLSQLSRSSSDFACTYSLRSAVAISMALSRPTFSAGFTSASATLSCNAQKQQHPCMHGFGELPPAITATESDAPRPSSCHPS